MKRYVLTAMSAVVFCLFAVPTVQAESSPTTLTNEQTVLISEINWAGSSASKADEWIELYNESSESVDLGGWILTGAATGGDAIGLESGTTIAPGSTLLIANYEMSHENTTLNVAPNLTTASLSLSNSELAITLASSDGTVIDSVSAKGATLLGATDPATSMTRNLETLEWKSSSESINLLDASQLGTPGAVTVQEHDEVEEIESDQESEYETSECHHEENEEVLEEIEIADEVETAREEEVVEEEVVEEKPVEEIPTYEPDAVIFSEIVSDPEDGTEWVELYNPGENDIDLEGWSIKDASSRSTALSGYIQANGYVVVENPNGNLNNDGDSLTLLDPSGLTIDTMSYGTEEVDTPEKGESLVFIGGVWSVSTTPTKGTYNVSTYLQEELAVVELEEIEEEVSEQEEVEEVEVVEESDVGAIHESPLEEETVIACEDGVIHSIVAIASSKDQPTTKRAGTNTYASYETFEGTLTALPGTFGSQIAFVEGIQLYFYHADWPELEIGDVVAARGTPSSSRGEPRLKISAQEFISIQEQSEPTIHTVAMTDLSSLQEGSLASVTGFVLNRDGDRLILEDDTGEAAAIAHSKTDVRWSGIDSSKVQLVGVVRHIDGEARLYPRSSDDVRTIEQEGAPVATSTKESGTDMYSTIGIALAIGAVSTLFYWYARREKRTNKLPIPIIQTRNT